MSNALVMPNSLERRYANNDPKQAIILDGQAVANAMLEQLKFRVSQLSDNAPKPRLVVVLVGDNPASLVYVNKKATIAKDLGLLSEVRRFDASITQNALDQELQALNEDPSVHAILVQMPLPPHLDSLQVLSQVAPHKDVDGFHPVNMGRLLSGQLPLALPCTPAGVIALLKAYDLPIAGKHAVVLGRSNIVGKPVGLLLLAEHATVSYVHSQTKDFASLTREADIIVAAVGVPNLINAHHVKPGVVVLDVGINRMPSSPEYPKGRLVGDVHFESLAKVASYITPVPGGVGPMTIATLMSNTMALYTKQIQ
jgi:methylenetetrahydrofolate dehydrogenase (NADP+) / methenyltetrahydrofolate cyclohydrolase